MGGSGARGAEGEGRRSKILITKIQGWKKKKEGQLEQDLGKDGSVGRKTLVETQKNGVGSENTKSFPKKGLTKKTKTSGGEMGLNAQNCQGEKGAKSTTVGEGGTGTEGDYDGG